MMSLVALAFAVLGCGVLTGMYQHQKDRIKGLEKYADRCTKSEDSRLRKAYEEADGWEEAYRDLREELVSAQVQLKLVRAQNATLQKAYDDSVASLVMVLNETVDK